MTATPVSGGKKSRSTSKVADASGRERSDASKKSTRRSHDKKSKEESSLFAATTDHTSTFKAYDFIKNDPNYLIRLCKNSKWKYVEKCCKMFCEILIRNANVDHSALLLKTKTRSQLISTDIWGNAPLHVACYYRPPLRVIKALMKASRYAFESNPTRLLTMANNKGATPLLIACQSGASQTVIKALLAQAQEVAIRSDKEGFNAFVALYNRYTLVQKIPAIRHRYLDLKDITHKDELALPTNGIPSAMDGLIIDEGTQSKSSLETFTMTFPPRQRFTSLQRIFGDWVDFDVDSNYSDNDTSSSLSSVLPYFWSFINDLLRASWNSSSTTQVMKTKDYISHLHGAAYVAELLPVDITDMILRTHRAEGRVVEVSTNEINPLQLAFQRRISYHPRLRKQHAHFVQELVQMDPYTIRLSMNLQGRNLFCKSIAMGHYWHLASPLSGRPEQEHNALGGPIQSLFVQCPDAVSELDQETGLYPFMLAATATSPTTSIDDEDVRFKEIADRLQLDTIYNLLRASPDLINS